MAALPQRFAGSATTLLATERPSFGAHKAARRLQDSPVIPALALLRTGNYGMPAYAAGLLLTFDLLRALCPTAFGALEHPAN